MYGRGVSIGAAQHIAAHAKLLVWQLQLAQQCGSQVRLVTYLRHHARALECAPRHDDGNVAPALVGIADALGIVHPVVGQHHHQRVAPQGRLPQTADKGAYAVVEISHGVGHLVALDAVVRHNPRLVAGQCLKGDVPRAALRQTHDALVERVKGNGVGHAPVVCAAHRHRKALVALNAVVASALQVAPHVGKVGIAAVQIGSGIARPLER